METFIHQIVAGIATGGVYASLALALVMIYQSTHHINFAQGEIAMFATYLAWTLINAGFPYWVAFFGTVLLAFSLGVLIQRVIIRPVENAPAPQRGGRFHRTPRHPEQHGGMDLHLHDQVLSPFPKEPPFGLSFISSHEVGLDWCDAGAPVMLYSFFRFTPLGLAMRAAAQNPDSSRLVGIRVGWMLALGWGLAAVLGSIAGMMIAPIVFLEPNMMSGVLLYAFAAALVGGIDSPGGAGTRRLSVGILAKPAGCLRDWYRVEAVGRAGLDRHGLDDSPGRTIRQSHRNAGLICHDIDSNVRRLQLNCPGLRITVVMAVACVLPFSLSNYHVFQALDGSEHGDCTRRPDILTGYSGQISLGHGAFLAIGAHTTAILMDKFDVPYWATIPVAGLVCLVAGFLFGLSLL
jgi:branched-chain amino acid transport system permease protein